MGLVIFESLPWVYNFVVAVVLLQLCLILAGTGKRYFSQVAVATVAVVDGAIGENLALTLGLPSFMGILGGALVGSLLCYYVRPVGVGMALAYLAYSVANSLVPVQYVQFVAAMVLFAYGLLLTDLAPSFVSGLLASAIVVLLAEWVGASTTITFELVSTLAILQVIAYVVPLKLTSRAERLDETSPKSRNRVAPNLKFQSVKSLHTSY